MHLISYLLPTLDHLGIFTYWIVLFVALLESTTFIGIFVPGGTILTLAGFISIQGNIDAGDLIWFAAIGAIIGDYFSYYLGTKGVRFFKKENRLLKENHLEKGKVFFKKHGPKSILIGRFIGPLRSVVPFIAGASKMDRKSFLFWNVIGGFSWAIFHVLLGYFFGNTYKSIEVWISKAGAFVLVLILLSLALWYLIKQSKPLIDSAKSLWTTIKLILENNGHIKKFSNSHPGLVKFILGRFTKTHFAGLPLTILSLILFALLFTFLGITQDIIASDPLVSLDQSVASFLATHRAFFLTSMFLFITYLGSTVFVIISASATSALLIIKKRASYIFPLILTLLGTSLSVTIIKLLIGRARPGADLAFYIEKTKSFPSGHAAISAAFYGFLGYYFITNSIGWKSKTRLFFAAALIIILIGLSRMYLGVHYLSDALGGFVLGLLWLVMGIITNKLKNTFKI